MWILATALCLTTIYAMPYQAVLFFDWSLLPLLSVLWKTLITLTWIGCMPTAANLQRSMWRDTVYDTTFIMFILFGLFEAANGDILMAKACLLTAFGKALLGMTEHIARRLNIVRRAYRWFTPGLHTCS